MNIRISYGRICVIKGIECLVAAASDLLTISLSLQGLPEDEEVGVPLSTDWNQFLQDLVGQSSPLRPSDLTSHQTNALLETFSALNGREDDGGEASGFFVLL